MTRSLMVTDRGFEPTVLHLERVATLTTCPIRHNIFGKDLQKLCHLKGFISHIINKKETMYEKGDHTTHLSLTD